MLRVESREAYDKAPGLTISTLLSGYGATPAHIKAYIAGHRERSSALDFGTAFHCLVLEPANFPERVLVRESYQRGGKPVMPMWKPTEDGVASIDADERAQIGAMRDVLLSTETWKHLDRADAKREVSLYWRLECDHALVPPLFVECKTRIDLLTICGGCPMDADLKTCGSASERAFRTDVWKYGYHARAAWTLDALALACPPPEGTTWRYGFVLCEKTPPFTVAFRELPDSTMERGVPSIEAGRKTYRRLLEQYVRGVKTGHWPGYADGFETIGRDEE